MSGDLEGRRTLRFFGGGPQSGEYGHNALVVADTARVPTRR
jgi:hypothetical protein